MACLSCKWYFYFAKSSQKVLEDSIKLESPVEAVFVKNERVAAISVKGIIQEVSTVISTAPFMERMRISK